MDGQLMKRDGDGALQPSDALRLIARMETVDDLLAALREFGRAGVFQLPGGGWHAVVNFPTIGEGKTAVVRSDYDHASPQDAMRLCLERCVEARSGS